MKKLKLFSIVIVLALPQMVFCQLNNFNAKGKKISLFSEKDSINIKIDTTAKFGNFGTLLLGAISPAANVGVDILKTVLDNRQQSYTAAYSASYTGSSFYKNNKFSPGQIKLFRLTKEKESSEQKTASKIVLSFVPDGNDLFRLKVDSILLNYSKARIKKHGKSGKTIDLSIDIKINAFWRDYTADYDKIKNDTTIAYTIKSAILGESVITVTGLKLNEPKAFNSNDNSFYTNWFQCIPKQLPKYLPVINRNIENRSRGWYSITVTVKEANPYGLNSNTLDSFLKGNGSDISSFIKALIP